MKDNDYFRAISVYKQILFFSDDIDTKNFCLLQISKAYFKSNNYNGSIKFLSRLLNQSIISNDFLSTAQIYLGLNYYGLKVYPIAENYLKQASSKDTTGFSSYYLALLDVEKSNWNSASEKYKDIHRQYSQKQIGVLSEQLSKEVLEGNNINKKSPFFASFISTILPGFGQFYCNHYYDGIQAFIYVSAFSFVTYASYRYDKEFNTNYLSTIAASSITGLFHIGNIIGAQRTASYYNLKQKQNFLDSIRIKVFSIDF